MKLIIGLGNPGKQYKKTRHNAGFIILDEIAHRNGFPSFSLNTKFKADLSKKTIHGQEVLLIKPLSFMNDSGQVVKKVMNFYKATKEDLIILHDDLDIELGDFKISPNSSAAGHNGIINIINLVGTQEFIRIRIGLEGAEKKQQRSIAGSDFVLQNFSDEELEIIKSLAQKIEKMIL